jgi:hypothetical protein
VPAVDRSTWKTPAGRLAALKALSYRSAVSGVWWEAFSTTALPAMIAGTTELTELTEVR